MSTSSGGKKNPEKKSCLAVVEADGLFDGRRRVRLTLPLGKVSASVNPTIEPGSEENDGNSPESLGQEEERLLGFQQSLIEALKLPLSTTTMASTMEIELYDPTNQRFRNLTSVDEIPSTCCRLRITAKSPGEAPSPRSNLSTNSSSSHPASNRRDEPLLALPWREFSSSIDLDGRLLLKDGRHSITIREVSNSGLGTGTNIWDGAIALAKFLEFHDRDDDSHSHSNIATDDSSNSAISSTVNSPSGDEKDLRGECLSSDAAAAGHALPNPTYSVRGKDILEIGAGTGLVGIAAHVALGARSVVLTDLEYSLGNLRDNIQANANAGGGKSSPTIEARVLDWFDLESCDTVLRAPPGATTTQSTTTTATATEPPATKGEGTTTKETVAPAWNPEVVLAADVVWVEPLVRPLVQTLHRICVRAKTPPLMLLSYQRRSQAVEDLLFRTLEEFSLGTEDVTARGLAATTTSGAPSKIRIYRISYIPPVN